MTINKGDNSYLVSSLGRVKSLKTNKFLKLTTSKTGYKNVCLCFGNKKKNYRVHRLVAEEFIPNLLSKPYVNHIDNNKQNNKLINLEWVTPQENTQHSKNQGRLRNQSGEKNNMSKLTKKEVEEIRQLLWERRISQTMIAKQYGVDQSSVSYIKNNKVWK